MVRWENFEELVRSPLSAGMPGNCFTVSMASRVTRQRDKMAGWIWRACVAVDGWTRGGYDAYSYNIRLRYSRTRNDGATAR